jgi:hypothetical protein
MPQLELTDDPDAPCMTMLELVNEETAPEFNAFIRAAKADDGSFEKFAAHARAEANLKAKTAYVWLTVVEGLLRSHEKHPKDVNETMDQIREALANLTQDVCTCAERFPQ